MPNATLTATVDHFLVEPDGLNQNERETWAEWLSVLSLTEGGTLQGRVVFAGLDGTRPGLNLTPVASNPSTLIQGDVWYNSATQSITYRDATGVRQVEIKGHTHPNATTTTDGFMSAAQFVALADLVSGSSAKVSKAGDDMTGKLTINQPINLIGFNVRPYNGIDDNAISGDIWVTTGGQDMKYKVGANVFTVSKNGHIHANVNSSTSGFATPAIFNATRRNIPGTKDGTTWGARIHFVNSAGTGSVDVYLTGKESLFPKGKLPTSIASPRIVQLQANAIPAGYGALPFYGYGQDTSTYGWGDSDVILGFRITPGMTVGDLLDAYSGLGTFTADEGQGDWEGEDLSDMTISITQTNLATHFVFDGDEDNFGDLPGLSNPTLTTFGISGGNWKTFKLPPTGSAKTGWKIRLHARTGSGYEASNRAVFRMSKDAYGYVVHTAPVYLGQTSFKGVDSNVDDTLNGGYFSSDEIPSEAYGDLPDSSGTGGQIYQEFFWMPPPSETTFLVLSRNIASGMGAGWETKVEIEPFFYF